MPTLESIAADARRTHLLATLQVPPRIANPTANVVALRAGQWAHDNAEPDDEGEPGSFTSYVGPIPVTVEYVAKVNAQGTVTGLSVTAIELDCQSVDPSEFSAENQAGWHRTALQVAALAWWSSAQEEAAAEVERG